MSRHRPFSPDAPKVMNGRYALGQEIAVETYVLWEERRGESTVWRHVGNYVTGIVMPYPSDTSADEQLHTVNVMPDEALPHGHQYASLHPVMFDVDEALLAEDGLTVFRHQVYRSGDAKAIPVQLELPSTDSRELIAA